ncbi:MAG: anthranilate synthase component [Nitrospirae bacterium]|nr:anthranilate synthase component [Nitrospirota bacterium]
MRCVRETGEKDTDSMGNIKRIRPIIGITTDIDGEYLRLKDNYCGAVEEAGGIPLLLSPVADTEPYAGLIHGLLIPGGADINPAYYREEMMPYVNPVPRKRSDFEMSLVRNILRLNKPVLGICYGMQLLNVFFGGSLFQDIVAQVPIAINHKNYYHKIVITENRFLTQGTFSVDSSHHQAIRTMGKGLSAIARSEDHLVEAFYSEQYHFLVGVQWHPERRQKDKLSQSIFHRFIKASQNNNQTT